MKKCMFFVLCIVMLALGACEKAKQVQGELPGANMGTSKQEVRKEDNSILETAAEVTNTPMSMPTDTPIPTPTNTPIPTPEMGTMGLTLSNYKDYIKISSTVNTRTGQANIEVFSKGNYKFINVIISVQMDFIDTLGQRGTSVEDIKIDENGNANEYIYYNANGKYTGKNPAISSCSYTILDVKGDVMGYGIEQKPKHNEEIPTNTPTNTPTPIPEKRVDSSTQLEYIIENNSVVITGIRGGYSPEVEIPKTIEGYFVVSIGENAFKGCEQLVSVRIADTVTSIEDEAFYECSSLVSVEIPNSVTYIGDGNFGWCKKLKTIVIPDSVIELGYGVFEFSGVENITLSNNLTEIKDGSFYLCDDLESIVIPDSVISIGDAFEECYGLKRVYISDENIIDSALAFRYCSPEFITKEQEENMQQTYELAIQMMQNFQYEQAIELFEQLGDYADSKAQIEHIREILQDIPTIGSIVYLGSYEQDNIVSNGQEPIEWIVLDIHDGIALLISKYVLDCQPISTGTLIDRSWETCLLREWLNEEFYNIAFNEQEKSFVLKTYVSAESKASGFFGEDTEDYVYLLSTLEMSEYKLWPEYTESKATAYAISKGVPMYTYKWDPDWGEECLKFDYEYPAWWTRSIGESYMSNEYRVTGATSHGYFYDFTEEYIAGVRPVIQIEVK